MNRRRDFLAFAAAAGASGTVLPVQGASAADSPDAELIALCGQFDALERHIQGLGEGPAKIEDEDARVLAMAPIEAAQELVAKRICSIVPKTLEGHVARMRTFLLWQGIVNPSVRAESADYLEDRFMAAMWRDLAGQV